MSAVSVQGQSFPSRLKLFMALSRTPHGVLDLATPALGALIWLGSFPPLLVVLLGMIAAFSGYTSVYALNDVVDYKVDREKVRRGDLDDSGGDLDSVFIRHPLAQGALKLGEGVTWVVFWAVLALVGAYYLNPVCALIFVLAAGLETTYCLLLKISSLRVVISGIVKTSGGLAAVFAVDSEPSAVFLAVFFLWLFFWEIGGQNVPNDLTDAEADKRSGAKTAPVIFGTDGSVSIILGALSLAVLLSLTMFRILPDKLGLGYLAGALLSGIFLLLVPAYRLYITKAPEQAACLFNRASYYPAAMFGAVMLGWIY